MSIIKTISEGVEALEEAMRRKERAELELEAAKTAVRELERTILPPLFAQARQKVFTHEDGTQALKRLGIYARWPKDEMPRKAATKFMIEIGHLDSLKAVVTATWGKGEFHLAQKAFQTLKKDTSATVQFKEDIHWKTYENIILETFQQGKHTISFDEIGAEVFDEVTITRRRETQE